MKKILIILLISLLVCQSSVRASSLLYLGSSNRAISLKIVPNGDETSWGEVLLRGILCGGLYATVFALLHGLSEQEKEARYNIETIVDEFDNYTIERMKGNILGGGETADLELNIQRFKQNEGEGSKLVVLSLVARYVGGDWLFIEPGESLILLVDGERIRFSGKGSQGHRDVYTPYQAHLPRVCIEEIAFYSINPELLHKIAYANEVKVKLQGARYYAERYFTPKNFENFRRFYEEYVEKSSFFLD